RHVPKGLKKNSSGVQYLHSSHSTRSRGHPLSGRKVCPEVKLLSGHSTSTYIQNEEKRYAALLASAPHVPSACCTIELDTITYGCPSRCIPHMLKSSPSKSGY